MSNVSLSGAAWRKCSLSCRDPETRSQLAEHFRSTNNLALACTKTEDWLEFKRGKAAQQEKDRLQAVRRTLE